MRGSCHWRENIDDIYHLHLRGPSRSLKLWSSGNYMAFQHLKKIVFVKFLETSIFLYNNLRLYSYRYLYRNFNNKNCMPPWSLVGLIKGTLSQYVTDKKAANPVNRFYTKNSEKDEPTSVWALSINSYDKTSLLFSWHCQ